MFVQGHTLVLGWNRQAPRLLRQLAADAHGSARALGRRVVVLSEQSKEAVEGEVERALQVWVGGQGEGVRWWGPASRGQ